MWEVLVDKHELLNKKRVFRHSGSIVYTTDAKTKDVCVCVPVTV